MWARRLFRMSNDVWLSTKEASDLLEVSDRTIQRNIKKYITKEVTHVGGKQYRIFLQSLGPTAVSKYYDLFMINKPIEQAISELKKISISSLEEAREHVLISLNAITKIAELKSLIRSNSNE